MGARFQVGHEVISLGGNDPWKVAEVRESNGAWQYKTPWGKWFAEADLIGLTHTRPPMAKATFRDLVMARS